VNFVEALRTAPMDRIRLIKLGIPARALERMANDMRIPLEQLATTLGLTRATVSRKVRENGALSADAGSRAIGMASLIGQVQKMIDESGDPDGFSAAEWVARWLDRPLPAIGGQKPAELMDTSEGQALISNILACMQAGTYA
jgi:putative toxin-antitoxin system antitoxin component (TIGR02293 family)